MMKKNLFYGLLTSMMTISLFSCGPSTNVSPITVTSLGVIGSFAASDDWTNEISLVKGEDNVWTGSISAVAGDEFKVRANEASDYTWGYSSITNVADGVVTNADGNIYAVADGTYSLAIIAPTELSFDAKDLTSFAI
ncbi:MAG: hypothetical protein WC201_05320, partial [Bacilli bacterium]